MTVMTNQHINRVRTGKNKSFVQFALSMYAHDRGIYDAGPTVDHVRRQLVSLWESAVKDAGSLLEMRKERVDIIKDTSLSAFEEQFNHYYRPKVCEGVMQKEKKRKGDLYDNLNAMIAQVKEWNPPTFSGDMKTLMIYDLERAKPPPYEDEEPPYADAEELRAHELKQAEALVDSARDRLSEKREGATTKLRQFDAFAESLLSFEFDRVNK